ncbi:MAG: hypothetical protein HOC91_13740 [Nitrospinaceae bacterium]|nr:hypothetical protein [Nitrospinaceae bacterium]MBT3434979.1 hypothetical protein [Nitrospinaceae bacterium]MBT4094378.1 hypothetical protein [Nitrospinaceae bacterium]MBT4431566.1 hypothetical protein [Nitrospinaceae bacterium]MBT5368157.1 hypothetical protein [Nitrospinaceae bacterium]
MSLYFYTKQWDAALGTIPGDLADFWEAGRELLANPAGVGEAIGRYQGGERQPTFAVVEADLVGIADRLTLAEGKEHIVVVGNGGSIRNVWALYAALSTAGAKRSLHLLDGTDPAGLLGEMISGKARFSPSNTLVLPVSKSGNTENVVQETRVILEKGYTILPVVGSGQNRLAELVREKGVPSFPHPDSVGGRFSAAQNNALLPLALALGGMETIREIATSFKAANERLSPDIPVGENMAKALALSLWRAELGGYTEIFMPIYTKSLSGLGKLIVQLVHESYCKAGKGQTFLFAEAPESQHHTNQRYFDGRTTMAGLSVRVDSFDGDFNMRDDVSAGQYLDLEHAGVAGEAERMKIPHSVLTLGSLGAGEIASAIALWQWAAVYGGLLRGVNPFDQPAVEGSKQIAIEMFKGYGSGVREQLDKYTRDASFTL